MQGEATPIFWLAFAVLVYTAILGVMATVVIALSAMASSGRLVRTVPVVAGGAWLLAVVLAASGGPEWFMAAITFGVLWSVPLVMREAAQDQKRAAAAGAGAICVGLFVLTG